MKINNKYKLLTGLLVTAGALSACNGGSGGATGGGQIGGQSTPITAQASKSLFSANSCLTGSFATTTGSIWYVSDTLTLTNTCSSAQDLSKQSVSVISQDNNGAGIAIGEVNNGWYSATQASYKITFNAGSGNQQVGTITASNNSPTLPANSAITFTGGFNINGIAYNSALSSSSFAVSGGSQPTTTGTLNVMVDTTSAGCTGTTVCNGLTVNVNNSSGTSVANFTVPNANLGGTYTVPVQNLASGSTYSVSATPITSTTVSYAPATATISTTESKTITVKYTPSASVGSATVSLPTYLAAYTSPLQVKIINSALESSPVVNTYSVTQGSSFATGDLPVSDSKHVYKVVMTTGIANPATGKYYYESVIPTLTITKGSPATLSIPMVQVAAIKLKNVTLVESGLMGSDTAVTTFSDSTSKYSYVNTAGVANSNVVYQVESGLLFGASTQASGSNTYTVNPIVNMATINAAKTFTAAFVKVVTPPSGATVAGWPNYLAMGAVTDANTANNGGLSGRPVDAIFKYGGDGGNGDPGRIVFPIYTLNAIAVAGSLTKESGKHVMPTMVDYTAEMSGGTAYKDFGYDQPSAGAALVYQGESIPAMHFVNLMLDAQTLQQSKSADNSYPGSIIINPDLLGMIQQQNLFANGGPLSTLNIPVNKSLQQATCFMKRKFGPTSFALPSGDTVTVSGTPMEMAAALRNSGKVWSYWDIKSVWEDKAVSIWYPSCVANSDVGVTIPTFADSFKGWIQATNWAIKYFGADVTFGWQENVWAVNSANWIHQLNSSQSIQSSISDPIVSLWKALEVYNGKYKPDFLVFDRYEMDDTAAYGSGYWYNARDWNNYLTFVQQISSGLGNQPVMLWQIPGGHIQTQAEVVANPSYLRASTAPGYFFGQPELSADLSNMADYLKQITLNSSYYNCSGTGCQMINYMTMNGYNWSKDNGNLKVAAAANVFAILWGGGSTQSVGTFPINDNGWLANKIINYYKSPQSLK